VKFTKGQKVRVTDEYTTDHGNEFGEGFLAKPGMEGVVTGVPEEPEAWEYSDPDFEPETAYAVDFPSGDWDVFEENELEAVK
jgi:hypothetical protein